MPTIEEHEKSMTLYYSKRTGEITSFATGIQDMNFFGNNKEDYEIIWGYIVLLKDQTVLDNTNNFKINVETMKLEIKSEEISQYPVAAT